MIAIHRLSQYLKVGARYITRSFTHYYMAFTISARISKQSLLKHMICLGGSGSGKTTLQMQMFYDMIRTSNGSKFPESCIMLEPHGDASLRAGLMRIIPRERLVFMSNAID